MSNKYLLNVSIGPVQEFIAEARKTRDLWIGSYLLSYITFKALEPFIDNKNCEIIYPSITDSPFYINKKKNGRSVSQEELQIASLPNHFLIVVPEGDFYQLIESSKKNFEKKKNEKDEKCWWLDLTKIVKDRIQPSFNDIQNQIGWKGNNWGSLWDSQVKDLWQYMWVAIPVTDEELNNNYQEKARRIQRFLEERKLTRIFNQWHGSEAIKCTQCGHREVLGPEDFGKISEFWDAVHRTYKTQVRKADRLCAICTIKRFIKPSDILAGLKEPGFESTRDIAVIPFREFLKQKKESGKFDEKELIENVNKLRKIIFPDKKDREPVDDVDDIEGDFLYEDELSSEKMLKEYFPVKKKGTSEYDKKKRELENPAGELRETIGRIYDKFQTKPSKYYAALFMDGDNMGKWMSGALPENSSVPFTKKEHTSRSSKLGRLGVQLVPAIVKRFKAYTVYSGGDDLLTLVPLDYVLDLAKEIRETYSKEGIHEKSTTSAGIVIAHYSYSFMRTLIEGRKAVERAKGMFPSKPEKDAFSITLILSSGTVVTGGYKWFLQTEGIIESVIDKMMARIIRWQMEELLSPRFIYDVLGCLDCFYYRDKLDSMLFKTEVARLFKRHCATDRNSKIKIPEQDIEDTVHFLSIVGSHDSSKRFNVKENLEGLLRISTFIARESVKI